MHLATDDSFHGPKAFYKLENCFYLLFVNDEDLSTNHEIKD